MVKQVIEFYKNQKIELPFEIDSDSEIKENLYVQKGSKEATVFNGVFKNQVPKRFLSNLKLKKTVIVTEQNQILVGYSLIND